MGRGDDAAVQQSVASGVPQGRGVEAGVQANSARSGSLKPVHHGGLQDSSIGGQGVDVGGVHRGLDPVAVTVQHMLKVLGAMPSNSMWRW